MTRGLFAGVMVLFGLRLVLAAAPAGVGDTLNRRLADQGLLRDGARIGVYIQSLTDGSIWYEQKAFDAFIPASNAKIVTAVVALDYLEPAYAYVTQLYRDGQIVDGELRGDLYLRGTGDPSLLPADLRALARALAAGDPARGIPPVTTVRGRIYYDESFFPTPSPLLGMGWEREDLPWYYAAPSSALSCQRNAVTVTVRGTEAGRPPTVTLAPETSLFTVENLAMTSTQVRMGAAEVTPRHYAVRVTGRIAPGAVLTERISVPDPLYFVAEQFELGLRAAGITFIGEIDRASADPRRHTLVAEHRSAALGELVATMMKESDNHTAEQLHWTLLALYSLKKPLSERYGALLQDFATTSDIPWRGMRLVDGSGLSRLNRVTPAGIARMLTFAAGSRHFPVFYRALPIAGEDGTLGKRMVGTPAAGNARAKTGTMRGVSSLSGYVTTRGGERLVYAILVNDYRRSSAAARKLQDDVVSYLAGL